MSDCVLDVVGLTKQYGRLKAVDDLSFSVREREIIGITGPNGAGKTTLFDLVSGVSTPTSGRVMFDGEDITGRRPDRVCHSGLVRTFQLNASFAGLTLIESVLVGAVSGGGSGGPAGFVGTSRAARRRAEDAIGFVGLHNKRHLNVGEASVLDLKLSMIACALATEPKLLMMDEPVGGLVPQEVDQVADLVTQLARNGMTIMIVEHVMRFLVSLSSRIIVMHHGAQLFDGPPEKMLHDPTVREVYLGGLEVRHG